MSTKRLIILFASSAVVGVIVALLLWGGEVFAPQSDENGASAQRTERVSDESVRIALTVDDESYEYGETMRLSVTVENESDEEQVFNFSSGCTDANIYVNEVQVERSKLCTQALVDVTLKPGEEQVWGFEYEVTPDSSESTGSIPNLEGRIAVDPGEHVVWAEWSGLMTDELSFEVRE